MNDSPDFAKREKTALTARLKLLDGGKITTREREAITWLENREREQHIADAYRNVPKTVFENMIGRSRRTIDEAADTHLLPISGPSIDLYEFCTTIYDRLLEYAAAARNAGDEDSLKEEKLRQEIERLRRQVSLLEIDIGKKTEELIPRQVVKTALVWLSSQFQTLGKRLGKQFGETAQSEINDFLLKIAAEVESGALKF